MRYDEDVSQFLEDCAKAQGREPSGVLRELLHLDYLPNHENFKRLVRDAPEDVGRMALALDRRLRLLNPGLHYVFRAEYYGYRREQRGPAVAGSDRSQVFISVVPRKTKLQVVLPLPVGQYADFAGSSDLSGKGHHGLGDLQVELRADDALSHFFERFDHWLRPKD